MLKRREFLQYKPPPAATDAGYWLHVQRTAMACRWEVTLPAREPAGVAAATEALAAVARLEAQLSVFRADSEISAINAQAAAQAVPVEAALFALLQRCRALHAATAGAFDVTAGPLSRCWGFVQRAGRLPSPAELAAARAVVGSEHLQLDAANRTVRFARAGMEINLGGIGKGYALDCVVAGLRRQVRAALVSGGASSMYALGNGGRGQAGWLVGIRHPRATQRRMAVLRLRDAALATSGNEEQFFELDGRRYGHLLDPRSGWPAEGVAGVTVVSDSAAEADALATAFASGGRALAESYCAAQPNTLVILLERAAAEPLLLGAHPRCQVEVVHE